VSRQRRTSSHDPTYASMQLSKANDADLPLVSSSIVIII